MTMDMRRYIDKAVRDVGGEWGIVIKQVGEEAPLYQLNPGKKFYAASVNKVAIALYVLSLVDQGGIDLAEHMALKKEYKLEGTGVLRLLDDGLEPTLKDLLTLMLIVSDNTAAKTLVSRFGSSAINDYLNSVGLEVTRLEELPEGKFSYGYTTPAEYIEIIEKIATGAYLRRESSDLLLEIMGHNHFDFGLGRHLHDPIKAASKQGTLDDMRHEVVLITDENERYIVSAFSEQLPDEEYSVDNRGVLVLAEIGRLFMKNTAGNE